jgi:hypothetical protein
VVVVSLAVLPRAHATDRDAPKPGELKLLRALVVIGNADSKLAPSVEQDRKNMKVLLEEHLPADRRRIDYLDGNRVTREEILKYYRNLKTGPDEALLFFYAGHGAIDPKLGHCLTPQMGVSIARADIRRAMGQKGAGLVVLLTDCCSIRIPVKHKARPREPRTRVEMHPVLRCLFFQQRGMVDVTAAEDGTGSYGDNEHGGVFTSALVSLLEGDLQTLDRNKDGFLSWKEFFQALTRETEKEFKGFARRALAEGERVEQPTQRPRAFSPLPDAPAAGAKKTYAVVSLRNDSGKAVRYRYRWAGEAEWKDGTVVANGKAFHELALAEGTKLPDLEIMADSGTDKGKGSLAAAKWSGTGRPAYEDGQEYRIGAK